MSDLHINREHSLGLKKSRAITDEWIKSAEADYRMQCSLERTDERDVVVFQRTGVQGVLVSTSTHFELTAKLGFLFRSFLPKIEEQINKNLDNLLS